MSLIASLIFVLLFIAPIVLLCVAAVYDELVNDRSGYQYWGKRAQEIRERDARNQEHRNRIRDHNIAKAKDL